jgi:hypothetical protein
MKLSVKITIVRAIMYIDDFFVTSKSICKFIFSQFGIFFAKQSLAYLLKLFGLSIKVIKTQPQREWLQPIYDDILVQVGDL